MSEAYYSPNSYPSDPTCPAPPPLSLPTLHLGSFDTASIQRALNQNSPSTRTSTRRAGGANETIAGLSRQSSSLSLSSSRSFHTPVQGETRRASSSSENTSPPLQPFTMALPAVPSHTPVSPFAPLSHSSSLSNPKRHLTTLLSTPHSPASDSMSTSLGYQSKARPLGHALTIHIPGPPTPPSEKDDHSFTSPPIYKQSPGIARRRTVIQSSAVAHEPSPVRVDGMQDEQSRQTGQLPLNSEYVLPDFDAEARTRVERGSIAMPTPALVAEPKTQSPRRLEKKPASHDLKNPSSPSSPTAKRSLPRPPKRDPAPSSTTWPPLKLNGNSSNQRPQPSPQPMRPAIYQKHQQNSSASSLPVIPGLTDAGPYPAGTPAKQPTPGRPAPDHLPGTVGLGRPSGAPVGGAAGAGPSRPKPEEVCLECMMRDRDLADVTVQGEGVWARASDADLGELIWREESLLRSMGDLESTDGNFSLPHSRLRSTVDDISFSEDTLSGESDNSELKRTREEESKKGRIVRDRKREADWRVCKEVGWRGFQWEEGRDGEGLPVGFRGARGNPLTEEGIKSVMTKFPSASAHRYSKLQDFLRNQWLLVLDTRAKAQELGHFPFPDDISSGSSMSSHEARFPPGARPGASAQSNKLHFAGVRPSPSSPANLSFASQGLQIPSRQPQMQRPMTQYIPEREPLTPNRLIGSPGSPSRHAKITSSPGVLEKAYPQSINTAANSVDIDGADDLWESGVHTQELRPFSFAVRAGAVRDDSEGHGTSGHGRRGLWGRWGGSVTSFFGGSQGGSGSMIDMHVGLESEKRTRTSSVAYPRAVSLASPTRPSFFGHSRPASAGDHEPLSRMSRVVSQSRLSQFNYIGEGDYSPDEAKKKGFKGFFSKMKPKGGRKNNKAAGISPILPSQDVSAGPVPDTPLAPPPPISALVRGERNHIRNGSGSSSSMLTDGPDSGQGYGRQGGSILYGTRSVSAPINNASSSDVSFSQSGSPASSRMATTTGARRDSYVSGGRRSAALGEMGEDRRTMVEMLSSGGANGSGTGDGNVYDGSAPIRQGKPNNKTTTSLSASSQTLLETPPPLVFGPGSFVGQQQQVHGHKSTTNNDSPGSLSPNRFKSLPPLPPPGSSEYQAQVNQVTGQGLAASPDSFIAAFPEHDYMMNNQEGRSLSRQVIDLDPESPYGSVRIRGAQSMAYGYPQAHPQQHPQPNNHGHGYGYGGRASLDLRGSQPRVEKQRAVQTMYGVPTMPAGGLEIGMDGVGSGEGEAKKKKGLKGFFGVSKNGRLA